MKGQYENQQVVKFLGNFFDVFELKDEKDRKIFADKVESLASHLISRFLFN